MSYWLFSRCSPSYWGDGRSLTRSCLTGCSLDVLPPTGVILDQVDRAVRAAAMVTQRYVIN